VNWACPVCGGRSGRRRWATPLRSEDGVDAAAFLPSSDRFGQTAGVVVQCTSCGHGSLAEAPPAAAVSEAYREAEDEVSIREEPGQVETARRDLQRIERVVRPGRVLDVGCWTGSFLVGARERGWDPVGIEPSTWASERARARGVDVHVGELSDHPFPNGSFRLVAMRDVVEHLTDPGDALTTVTSLLEPGGVLFVTTPDAGSVVARLLGRRWWSVLPMHVQYFTRSSLERLLTAHGLRMRSITTHPKVFSARYYAERLGGYGRWLESVAEMLVGAVGRADDLMAPDFRDRMAVIATAGT
jgi:SAM-dependent methyltransferase